MKAIVTGGSRGIGAAIVRKFAISGIEVALVYRSNHEAAKKTVSELPDGSAPIRLFSADLSDTQDTVRVAEEILSKMGPVDILVNNAGITRDGLSVRMGLDQFTEVIDTNLVSAFALSKACIQGMMKNRFGRIINLSSVSGIYGNAGQANYAASKAALIGMTKSLAKELGGRNITVNAVAPGFIETDMTRVLSDDMKDETRKRIPMKRFGTPDDIAATVAFLASDEASYVTGQVIEVSGGLVI